MVLRRQRRRRKQPDAMALLLFFVVFSLPPGALPFGQRQQPTVELLAKEFSSDADSPVASITEGTLPSSSTASSSSFFSSPSSSFSPSLAVSEDAISPLLNASSPEDLNPLPRFGTSKRLTEFLLGRHNPKAPPDGIINVFYEMELVHILGIDELRQTMTALVYVDQQWSDPSLSWNETEFDGQQRTWIPLDSVWIPDIIIFNMLSHEDLLSSVRAPLLINSNGTCELSQPAVYTVSCEINIKHFPLDDQRCSLEIASWAYDHSKIRMHAHTEHSLQHYTDNEEWRLLHVIVKEDEYEHEGVQVSQLSYQVMLKRKPLFYMVTLTFPSYIMCAISVVGLFARFSTTGEREERFTLGVTAILTMAVLSLVVSEKVPHSSTSVPLLVIYFLFNMVIVSVAAMTTGLTMTVHRMGRHGRQPPPWLLRIVFLSPHSSRMYECDCGAILRRDGRGSNHVDGVKTSLVVAHFGSPSHSLFGDNHIQQECTCDGRRPVGKTRLRRAERNGYERLASRLDTILMAIFLAIVTVPVVTLFSMMD